jgi:membrane protein DedA with SNARE-associated domain
VKSPELPGFLQAVAPFLSHYGLSAVGVLVFLEDFGVPVPGETVLIAAAIYAGAGKLNIVAVGVAGFIAAVIGDNVGYLIGLHGGRRLALRYGKYVFLTSERLGKAEAFVERHGGKVITIARFIEGLRQANGLVAGIVRMRWLRFLAWNALGAALWVSVWVTTGYFAGSHIAAIYTQFERYVLYVVVAAIVIIIALIGWRLRGRWLPRLRRHRGGNGHGGRAGEDGGDGNGEAGKAGGAGQGTGVRKGGEGTAARTAGGGCGTHEAGETGEAGEADEASKVPPSTMHISKVHETIKASGPGDPQQEDKPHQAGDTGAADSAGADSAGMTGRAGEPAAREDQGGHGGEAARRQGARGVPGGPGSTGRP